MVSSGMEKPTSANSGSSLRGDYEGAAADYTIGQAWDRYTPQMHDRWRRLHARQTALAQRLAAPQVLSGLAALDCAEGIPDFAETSRVLRAATGWQVVAVPGFIPDDIFFDHLANRRFPVTNWIREEHELDYLVEPDIFHDFFGHVPMLLDPTFASFMQAYGGAGRRAIAMDALDMLARIYWYTVEFGLIDEGKGLKAYGAGIVSSAGELVFSTEDVQVQRLLFDPVRVMRTAYNIDRFQSCYFVLESFEQLLQGLVDLDFGPIYKRWRETPPLPAGEFHDGDRSYRGNAKS
ncbi:phenylalanine 4-monooxygenase [Novosphingobium sp. G106]|uniref:phenylalanine 4-monooxygenase n=1 Tax=Novosphingobium sp. G106 TaxID=2849500 RepID=UPI0020C3C2C8|nr:phenylalanine 4-monooxygenase [Novosphingobium sp. G106]